MPHDRLSALDASFLHLERLETPMHVGAVSVFEGDPFRDEDGRFRIAEVRDLVASRLHLIPRFRKRLMAVPFQQGRPIWVDDQDFDITYHVRLTALPRPGAWEQLVTLTTRVQEQLLDRTRPLWELWFVEGLEDGRVGLIQKTHHALVDGVSGVDVATILLDVERDRPPTPSPEWVPETPPSASQLLLDSVVERVSEPAELVRSARAAIRGPRVAVRRARKLAGSVQSMVGLDSVAPRTSLNTRHTGRHRRLAVVRVPIDDVRSVRRALGGTVNDVLLAGVAGGLSRLLTGRGEAVRDRSLRAMCPVSVRSEPDQGSLGNKVSAMFVPLPIDDRLDPASRLAAISAVTRDLKEREQAVGADFLVNLTQYAAPTLLSLAAQAAHRQPFFNLVCTNVPGPQFPLYLMGARLIEAYPIVPLTRNLTVVVGILSYDGTVHLGLFADRDSCSDVEAFAAAIDDSFAEMVKLSRERAQTG